MTKIIKDWFIKNITTKNVYERNCIVTQVSLPTLFDWQHLSIVIIIKFRNILLLSKRRYRNVIRNSKVEYSRNRWAIDRAKSMWTSIIVLYVDVPRTGACFTWQTEFLVTKNKKTCVSQSKPDTWCTVQAATRIYICLL